MERANGARNGKTQSEPRAKRVHEPMAPGAVRRTAWVADAGAPVPSVFLGGVPGRMGTPLWGGHDRMMVPRLCLGVGWGVQRGRAAQALPSGRAGGLSARAHSGCV